MTIALIDADSACYAAAFINEGRSEEACRLSLNGMIEDTLIDLNTKDFCLYITSNEGNFRYKYYPEYKAHRKQEKPTHLQMCKDHLKTAWGAIESVGCEADDLIGVDHYKHDCESIVCSIDKDLDQFPGWHWNPAKRLRYLMSPMDSKRFFYTQMLQGDTADNIKGVAGIGKVKAERMLRHCTTGNEMFDVVRDAYGCDQELFMNAVCLHLWTKENDIWQWPSWASPMEEISGMDTSEA